MYYSWEGNPINISCDVTSNPPASIHWRREKLVLPAKNTTHLKTYSVGRKMILEVSLHLHINKHILTFIDYVRIHLIWISIKHILNIYINFKLFWKINFSWYNILFFICAYISEIFFMNLLSESEIIMFTRKYGLVK